MNNKSLMFIRMIVASLVRRRSRMVIALLAIIVGATILSGLVMIYIDVPRQMSSEFRSYGANVIFTSSGDGYISDEDIKKGISYISKSELEGYTPYRYENTQIHNMPVSLAGIDFDTISKTSPYWHISGELPSSDGEILLGEKVAESIGVKEGDTVTAENSFEITDDIDLSNVPDYEIYYDTVTGEGYCDHELEFIVTGILSTGGSEEEYAYVSISDIEYLSLTQRGYDIVEVSIASTQDKLTGYINKINDNTDKMTAKLVKRVTASESTVLTKLQSLVLIVTAVILILTMICVATTMTAVIAERRKEIGLRKALGADDSSIVGEFLCEGLLLGAIGGVLGLLLGYAFAQYVSVNVFSGSITFRPALIPVTIIVSVLVAGLACIVPIKSAVDVDPALVLKGE